MYVDDTVQASLDSLIGSDGFSVIISVFSLEKVQRLVRLWGPYLSHKMGKVDVGED